MIFSSPFASAASVPGVNLQVDIGLTGRRRSAWVDDHQACRLGALRLEMLPDRRHGFGRVARRRGQCQLGANVLNGKGRPRSMPNALLARHRRPTPYRNGHCSRCSRSEGRRARTCRAVYAFSLVNPPPPNTPTASRPKPACAARIPVAIRSIAAGQVARPKRRAARRADPRTRQSLRGIEQLGGGPSLATHARRDWSGSHEPRTSNQAPCGIERHSALKRAIWAMRRDRSRRRRSIQTRAVSSDIQPTQSRDRAARQPRKPINKAICAVSRSVVIYLSYLYSLCLKRRHYIAVLKAGCIHRKQANPAAIAGHARTSLYGASSTLREL